MANRRMITRSITSTMKFLNMSKSAQALYLHLVAESDDDGVAEGKVIIRMSGCRRRDFDELVSNGFVTVIEPQNNVCWVTDWQSFNYVKNGCGTPSIYRDTLVDYLPDKYFPLFTGKNEEKSRKKSEQNSLSHSPEKNRISQCSVEQQSSSETDNTDSDQYSLEYVKAYAEQQGYDSEVFKPELFYTQCSRNDWKDKSGKKITDVARYIDGKVQFYFNDHPETYAPWLKRKEKQSAKQNQSKTAKDIVPDEKLQELLKFCKNEGVDVPQEYQEVWRAYNATRSDDMLLLSESYKQGYICGEPVIIVYGAVYFPDGHTDDLKKYDVISYEYESEYCNNEKFIITDKKSATEIKKEIEYYMSFQG